VHESSHILDGLYVRGVQIARVGFSGTGFNPERSLRQLLDYPREEMATEIKDWLDLDDPMVRAKLAKGLIALANHGGGYLLFGFSDTPTGWVPSGPCPYELDRYSQGAINAIAKRHAEPVFECHVTTSRARPAGRTL